MRSFSKVLRTISPKYWRDDEPQLSKVWRMEIQRRGWLSRFTISKFRSCTERLSSIDRDGKYWSRHFRIKFWHRSYGFPFEEDNLKAQAERLSQILDLKWSWRSGGCYIWNLRYDSTVFRLRMGPVVGNTETDVLLKSTASDDQVREVINVVYVKLMLMRYSRKFSPA